MRLQRHLLYSGAIKGGKVCTRNFLDRDGTINVDHGYVHEIVHLSLYGAALLTRARAKKWAMRWWW